ncbi:MULTISPECIES: hypothetical protein [unclassified Microbulbifer]|uniref:hypothetical protein n=1 Tax=unclassified Microbulbifer TaxID=2619833 RepID=UPI0027E5457D|nr:MULTISPECIES: hypothetical protein [unclassified Microbulbifer]
MNIRLSNPLLALCCCALATTAAADDKADINFEASAGLEYDNNLTVQELDRVANVADTATLLNARVEGRFNPTKKLTLKGGYRHTRKAYREFDKFDQTVGNLSFEASYDFSLLTLGSSYHRANADLAGEPFLELEQRSLYAGKLLNDRFYLRAALNQRDKTFSDNPARDAAADGVDTDLFVFFNEAASFFSLGLSFEDEDADSNLFDYRGFGFRGRYSNRFSLWGRDNTFQLAWRRTERDYSAFNPAIDGPRNDVRSTLETRWEIELSPAISAVGKVEYGNHDSDLESADYSETLASLVLKASF